LLKSTLALDPSQRITAQAVLSHTFFSQEPLPCQPHEIKINQHLSCHELDVKKHRENQKEAKERQLQQQQQVWPPSQQSQLLQVWPCQQQDLQHALHVMQLQGQWPQQELLQQMSSQVQQQQERLM